jgi:hypothetical protein
MGIRYGHAMTAFTGIANWLQIKGFVPEGLDVNQRTNFYKRLMLEFLQHKKLKVKLVSKYKGTKINITAMQLNANAYTIQQHFEDFKQFIKEKNGKNI